MKSSESKWEIEDCPEGWLSREAMVGHILRLADVLDCDPVEVSQRQLIRGIYDPGTDSWIVPPVRKNNAYKFSPWQEFLDDHFGPQFEVTMSSGTDFTRLLKILRRGPHSKTELANELDLSPARLEELLDSAKDSGLRLELEGDHVGSSAPAPDHVNRSGISPVKGERQMVAVISDTHLGSKYCMREQLADFMTYAHDKGVRNTLHVGDVLDGNYRHGRFELTHVGLDEQARDLAEVLPFWDDHHYHAITGNHDETFWEASGVDVGRAVISSFRDHGRDDLRFYGDRSAFIELGGVVFHLWHPRGSGAYARSYKTQKKVESYVAVKPHVLLTGHYHQYNHTYIRGVHAIMCPTFQGSMSRFGQSLAGGGPTMGGLILSWTVTELGSIRDFHVETRFYFEDERPVRVIRGNMDGEVILPAITRPVAVPDRRYG